MESCADKTARLLPVEKEHPGQRIRVRYKDLVRHRKEGYSPTIRGAGKTLPLQVPAGLIEGVNRLLTVLESTRQSNASLSAPVNDCALSTRIG